MLDLLASEPRVIVGAVVGFLIGLACAFALHAYVPGTSPVVGAGVAAVGLVLGVLLGAK